MDNFSIRNTKRIKGIAICMLLWHHLFYTTNINESIATGNISSVIAFYAKVCVAIFVFLTGYGLYKSYNKSNINILQYYSKNFRKIYFNYWLVWIIFVPIGILIFKRNFEVVYGQDVFKKVLINLSGFQALFGQAGYNVTWWYIGLVVGLYIIYPFVNSSVNKIPVLTIVVSIIILFLEQKPINGIYILNLYGDWLFPFVLGTIWAKYNIFVKVKNIKINGLLRWILYFCMLLLIISVRKQSGIFYYTKIDGVFTIVLLQIIFEIKMNKGVIRFLEYIGDNSFNIFLTHTFIYMYYFNNIFEKMYNPILKFIFLLGLSILISIIVEKIKELIKVLGKRLVNS